MLTKKNKLFIIVIHQRLTKQQRYYETKNLKKKQKKNRENCMEKGKLHYQESKDRL